MRLRPKTISRETIHLLMESGEIQVKRITDAERGLCAVIRQYIAEEERAKRATRGRMERLFREGLERWGYDPKRWDEMKRETASRFDFRMGDVSIEDVVDRMIRVPPRKRHRGDDGHLEQCASAEDLRGDQTPPGARGSLPWGSKRNAVLAAEGWRRGGWGACRGPGVGRAAPAGTTTAGPRAPGAEAWEAKVTPERLRAYER